MLDSPPPPALDVLLPTVGSYGDVFPVLALGRALRARGHHATVVTNDHYRGLVQRMGLDFVALGTEAQFGGLLEHPDLWHPRRSFPLMMRSGVGPLIEPLVALLAERRGPRTVVAASPLAVGARVAREALGLPLASVILQPSMLRSLHRMPSLAGVRLPDALPAGVKRAYYRLVDRLFVDPVMVPVVEPPRLARGLPPRRSHFGGWMLSDQLVLGLYPDWFAPRQPDWPAHYRAAGFLRFDPADVAPEPADHRAEAELQAFLAAGEPPLVFTPGTAMRQGAAFFRAALEASVALGRRALFLTGFAEQVPPDLPPGIRHFAFLPLGRVLARSAALVSHGGIGSVAQGLAAGVPQLVMPMAYDQFDNAERLEALGVGLTLPPGRFRGPALARELRRLLDGGDAPARAAALAGRVDQDGALAAACAAIESLAP